MGKTTCAAAMALAFAGRGRRVLVVSTDPAHSLGDVLGVRLSSRPRRVPRVPLRRSHARGALHAAEIDAPRALSRWIAAHAQALADIIELGTWLDREDVGGLLSLPIPGVDELLGLLEVVRLATSAYDEVVVDTAPTGHTLRLLASPETVKGIAAVLDSLYERHRMIRDRLARVGRVEAADRLIELLSDQARGTAALLRDRRRASFHWVTLPEEMSLAETTDAIRALDRAEIHIGGIIVNRVIPGGRPCAICDRRRASEGAVIERLSRRYGRTRTLVVVSARFSEPRGTTDLRRIAMELTSDRSRSRLHPTASHRSTAPLQKCQQSLLLSVSGNGATITPESLDTFRSARLVFFGGKGGVGKTTAAATVALRLARANPALDVLLMSTDPAHSLHDVFGQPIGDRPVRLRGGPQNLYIRELDAAAVLVSRRAALEAALNEIGNVFGAGDDVEGRRAAELLQLAPPGIDELIGLVSVIEARSMYQLIVMDTAPTGHALRLLEMPETARAWTQALLRVLLKYRSLVRPEQLAVELVDLSKSIRGLQTLMRDGRDTRFAVVTRAASVPRLETERLLGRLDRLKLSVPAVIVNAMTLGPGKCPRCRSTAVAERRELTMLRRRVQRDARRGGVGVPCVIIQTPLAAPAPRGKPALEEWGRWWSVYDQRSGSQRT